MQKIELTISPNYVPSWTIVDAVRELFQNALDQEKQCPGNNMDWNFEYKNESGTLTISNKKSVLTAQSLLLGQTTKANDAHTIGQFGEGYKIATLVLLRNDKQITFYNYGAKEIWRPRFVKSRRFGTDILTFFIEKAGSFWTTPPNSDLSIEVSGITAEEFDEIVQSNLHIRDDFKIIESTQYGDVVDIPGKVFVNGLFVCNYEPYHYGYNFKSEYLKLDRDRKMASDFDLRWLASKLWSSTKTDDIVLDLIEKDAADIAYINDVYGNITYWREAVAQRFRDAYGPEAIPVTSQEDRNAVPHGYKGVIVPTAYNSMIRAVISIPRLTSDDPEPKEKLQKLFDELALRYNISDEDVESFNAIMEDL